MLRRDNNDKCKNTTFQKFLGKQNRKSSDFLHKKITNNVEIKKKDKQKFLNQNKPHKRISSIILLSFRKHEIKKKKNRKR